AISSASGGKRHSTFGSPRSQRPRRSRSGCSEISSRNSRTRKTRNQIAHDSRRLTDGNQRLRFSRSRSDLRARTRAFLVAGPLTGAVSYAVVSEFVLSVRWRAAFFIGDM